MNLRLLAWGFAGALTAQMAVAKVIDGTASIAGMTVHYKVVLPADYDPAQTYPAVLAFPPGSQDMSMVMTTLVETGPGRRPSAGTSW